MEEALLLEHESRKQKQAEEEMDGLISSLHCDVVTMHQQHQGVGRGESQGGSTQPPNSFLAKAKSRIAIVVLMSLNLCSSSGSNIHIEVELQGRRVGPKSPPRVQDRDE